MPKLAQISHLINLPEGVGASMNGNTVTLAKDGQSLSREFRHHSVEIRQTDSAIEVFCNLPRRADKAIAGTWAAHLRNMVRGVDEGFEYRLKAVYSHFPMTLKVDGSTLTITNLFGERVPRQASLPWTPAEVTVKVENKTEVVVSGIDKEKVGQTSANIERACRIRGRDRRVFQDGVYIGEKA